MAKLTVFNHRFLHRLLEAVPENLPKYEEDESWVEDWANGESWELPTACELAAPLKLMRLTGKEFYDVENAIALHKALPSLTPVQAQDPRLWARLTHVELWDYMRQRWPIERYKNKDESFRVGRIRERYFVTQRQSRALMRNGAARLWWAAKLTFDAERDNPYELTHVLLKSLDLAKNLLERNFGRAQRLTHTFLDFVLKNKEECLENGNESRLLVRRMTKALNFHGGICLLDCMTRKETVEFLTREKAKPR